MNLEGVTFEQASKLVPSMIAEQLCSVQPMNDVDFPELANDPLAQALLGRFYVRYALSQVE